MKPAPLPLKVFLLIASLEIGGAQRLVVDLLNHLDRKRVSPSLVLSRAVGPFIERVPIDCPIFDLARRSKWDFPFLAARLCSLIRRERPDAILSVLFHANMLAWVSVGLLGTKVPVVMSEHISIESYRRGPRWVPWMMRTAYPAADRFIAVSEGVGKELVNYWGVSESTVDVIHNPVDLDHIQKLGQYRLEGTLDPSRAVIVSVGRFTAQKDFSGLLHAFARMRRSMSATLVLVGDGEERQALQQLAKDLGIGDDVIWPGYDPNPYRWIARANLFVLSSLYEGFGIVITEAMALGVPVVATDCPHGPAEILRGGQDGILVPPADERLLAQAMVRVLTDDSVREKLITAGQERVKTFSAMHVAEIYAQTIEAVAASKKRGT